MVAKTNKPSATSSRLSAYEQFDHLTRLAAEIELLVDHEGEEHGSHLPQISADARAILRGLTELRVDILTWPQVVIKSAIPAVYDDLGADCRAFFDQRRTNAVAALLKGCPSEGGSARRSTMEKMVGIAFDGGVIAACESSKILSNRWPRAIPVTERIPAQPDADCMDEYFCFFSAPEGSARPYGWERAEWDGVDFWYDDVPFAVGEVTHWMSPPPDPPLANSQKPTAQSEVIPMNQAVLTRAECEALSLFFNQHIADVPDSEISDGLRSAAAKIEAVVTSPEVQP